jgi:hypothetical protein
LFNGSSRRSIIVEAGELLWTIRRQRRLPGEYFRLARFLQPSMMVIEDVDLIGRERTHRHGGDEVFLNP